MLRYTPDENGNMLPDDNGEYIHVSDLTPLKVGLQRYKDHEAYIKALLPLSVNREMALTLFQIMEEVNKSLE